MYLSIATSLSSSLRNLAVTGESGIKMLRAISAQMGEAWKFAILQDHSRDTNGDQAKEEKDDLSSELMVDLRRLIAAGPYLVRRENRGVDMTQSICDQTAKLLSRLGSAMVTLHPGTGPKTHHVDHSIHCVPRP